MRSPENIEALKKIEPEYMGLIFWEPSKRYVETPVPAENESFQRVGVFVDAHLDYIHSCIQTHQLELLQLHGKESPERCAELQKKALVIKAFAVGSDFDFKKIMEYEDCCDYFLFDTQGPLPGGNGKGFDWTLLEAYPSQKPFFLSGGIGMDTINAIQALQKTNLPLHAIDVNSKFETEAGIKDISLLQQFKKECDVV